MGRLNLLGTIERTIPVGDRVLLDTTVLAAYLDPAETTHPVARHVVDDLVRTGRNPAVVSMVTVMELLLRPLRASPPGHHTVLAFLRHHPNLEPIPLDLQMAQEAASLRATHRLSPPDALIVATGIASQVAHLVTNDAAWAKKLAILVDRIGVVTIGQFLEAS
ncbi:MAG: PIN domain-containing protein [Candidatus Limnocylindria bacterium]